MSLASIHLDEPLSPPRIGGIAAALAVHVAALMMLMAPMTYAPPLPVVEDTYIVPEFIKPKDPPPVLPPPKDPKPEVKPVEAKLMTTPTLDPPVDPAIITNDSGPNSTPYIEPTGIIVGPVIPPPSGPISLRTEYAPSPRYPVASLRNGEQGTVLLLVMVDATGKPIDVQLKKSSGYRELDRNAIKHVLATWRFHPATHQGIAIPALALVPVEYIIPEE